MLPVSDKFNTLSLRLRPYAQVTIISDDATASTVERIAAICHLPINSDELGLATASWGEALRNALKVYACHQHAMSTLPMHTTVESLPPTASHFWKEALRNGIDVDADPSAISSWGITLSSCDMSPSKSLIHAYSPSAAPTSRIWYVTTST